MSNEYYNPTGVPAQNSTPGSAPMRSEFSLIQSGFSRMPTLAGNANRVVFVNTSATGLVSVEAATARTQLGAQRTLTAGELISITNPDGVAGNPVISRPRRGVIVRSTNVELGVADIGFTIRATASFTQTFATNATLGNDWSVAYLIDAGVTITFDPAGAELFDGAATRAVTGPASLLIVSDGTGLRTLYGPAPFTGGTLSSALNYAPFIVLVSAATTDLSSAASNLIRLTGAATVTSFGAVSAGQWRHVWSNSTATLAHGPNLILPGGANITLGDGDQFVAIAVDTNVWRVVAFTRATGAPLLLAANSVGAAQIIDGSVAQAELAAAVVPLGVGQTWQNVTGSRARGTTYHNTTGRPILVAVSGSTWQHEVLIDGLVMMGGPLSGLNNDSCIGTFLVPNGSSYQLTTTGSFVLNVWAELR